MEELTSFALWLWVNKWHLVVLALLLIYGKRMAKTVWETFVLQPIQGKDKNTSMRELAQYALVVLLAFMVISDTPPFGYEKMAVLVLGVAAIAGVQVYNINNKKPPTGGSAV